MYGAIKPAGSRDELPHPGTDGAASGRETKRSNRPYTGKKFYSDIYRLLSEGNFKEVKNVILESKRSTREELVRIGLN